MIKFDSLTLKAFINENTDYLKNSSVRKIQQPSRRELILHLRNNGINKKLYININPEFFHVCFLENVEKRGIIIPNAAPMFCMLLRKYILNCKISKVEQPNGERILELYFEYSDAIGETETLCLAIELMGKYSNIILYNKKTGIILGCAHNVGEEKSKVRELAGTLPYIYPEKQEKSDIMQTTETEFANNLDGNFDETSLSFTLSTEYDYLTIPLAKQAISKAVEKSSEDNQQEFLKNLYEILSKTIRLKTFTPSIKTDYSEFSLIENLKNFTAQNSVNAMIDKYFEYQQIQNILKQKKGKLSKILENKMKKVTKLSDIQKEKINLSEKADKYKQKADTLMMNLNAEITPKMTLTNPYDNTVIEIEPDINLTVIQNANKYYKLYKKMKTASEYAAKMIEETKETLASLDEQMFYVSIASNLDEISELETEFGITAAEQNKNKNKKHTVNLKCHEIDGFKIYLGKNSIQNDYLLSKIAAPEDLWFHPSNMPGAHVILKKNNSKEIIPDKVLLQCAKLTKRFSKTQNDSRIPVIYTERKYVKKANSKIAFVTYKNEKEIYC